MTLLRAKINIIEALMSENKWSEIAYEHVPSRAMKLYMKAFSKKDQERFQQYLDSVKRGEKKTSSSFLPAFSISAAFLHSPPASK